MEHLFCKPTKAVLENQIHYVFNSTVLQHDWNEDSDVPEVSPRTEWLGFDQDDRTGTQQSPGWTKFESYPVMRGFDLTQVWQTGDPRNAHPSLKSTELSAEAVSLRLAAVLQSWLTFGWLETIMKKEIRTSYLVRTNKDGKSYFVTQNLPSAILAWQKQMDASDVALSTAATEEAGETLNTVAGVVQRLLYWIDPDDGPGTWRLKYPGILNHLIMFMPSVVRLADAICLAGKHITDNMIGASEAFGINLVSFKPARNIRKLRLIDRGWCPALIRKFEYLFTASFLDWLDGSGESNPISGHQDCDEHKCLRNDIDPTTYEMRHQAPECECPLIKAPEDRVLQIIDNGDIPTITTYGVQENLTLDVVPCPASNIGGYVAFSHVWVDDLGSSTEKGIPRCQASRFESLARVALGRQNAQWWIDSVCVPTAQKQRRKAISSLRSVYRNATIVMVIDRHIRECSMFAKSGTIQSEAILWAIVSSAWMQRLWTYQESYLAKRLAFEFSDGIWEYQEPLPRPPLPLPVSELWSCLAAFVRTLRPRQRTEELRGITLGALAYSVNWRTTSRAGDEALAVAAVLDIDPTRMMDHIGEDRMKELYLSVKSLPRDILLYTSPKLALSNFHWAPKTLMARSPINIEDAVEAHILVCTPDSLKGVFQALILSQSIKWQSSAEWHFLLVHVGPSTYQLESQLSHHRLAAFDAVLLDRMPFFQKDATPRIVAAAVRHCVDHHARTKVEYIGSVMVSKLLAESAPDYLSGLPAIEATWADGEFCVS